MKRRTLWIIVTAAAALVLGTGAIVAKKYFWPEDSVRFNESLPVADDGSTAVPLKEGTFSGSTGHSVSGTVKILQAGSEYYLRFEAYNQTEGPDVFVYLTEIAAPSSKGDVEAGLRVLIDGGDDGGESTKVGTFNQKLPADFDPAKYRGVAIWCDEFNVLFGNATLEAA